MGFHDDPLQALSGFQGGDRYSDDGDSDVLTSPTVTDGRHSNLSVSNGYTTERDSIYSLGEDEFDRKASRLVRQLFEEIDSMLFEDFQGPENLYTECKEWVDHFPHLRILGEQKVPPQDVGFEWVARKAASGTGSGVVAAQRPGTALTDVTEQELSSATHALHDLVITGSHMSVLTPPPEAHSSSAAAPSDSRRYEREEILAQDGVVEDIIAVDHKSTEDEWSSVGGCSRRRHGGMPPVTPQALVLNLLIDSAFDLIWAEVIAWMRRVTSKYAVHLIAEDESIKRTMALALQGDLLPPSTSTSPRDVFPPSREVTSLSSSRLYSEKSQRPTLQPLDGLLNISQKPVFKREKSSLQDTESQLSATGLPLSRFGVRPGSGLTHFSYGAGSAARPSSTSYTSGASRLRSAQRRTSRLPAIESRTRTPATEDERSILRDEVLRGKSLAPVSDRLTSPPPASAHTGLSFPRNGALPPISYDQHTSDVKKPGSVRASSAVHDKDARAAHRERSFTAAQAAADRPSTTQTVYRSDTAFSMKQRSTTPLGFSRSAQTLPGNASSTNVNALSGGQSSSDVLNLDVRGSSINQPSGLIDPVELEETEHIQDMIQAHWDYRGRLIHSSVFRNLEGGVPPHLRRAKQPYSVGSVR